MSKVMIFWDKDVRAYRMRTQYDRLRTEKAISLLKQLIPHTDRNWDPDTKVWTFNEPYLDGVVKLVELIYGKPEIAVLSRSQVEAQTSLPSKSTISGLDSILLDFMRLLPYEAAQKAYKTAALFLHPDRPSGSMELMTKLNTNWQRIEKEFYKQ